MIILLVALFAGILLAHLFESALKAAILVVLTLCVLHIASGVTYEALVDDGARAAVRGAAELSHEASDLVVHDLHAHEQYRYHE